MTKTERWELAEVQNKSYNILFILTDQERYFHPKKYLLGYTLTGRDRLQRQDVTL